MMKWKTQYDRGDFKYVSPSGSYLRSHYDLMPLLVEFIDSIRQSVSLLKSSDGVKMVEESYIRHLYRYGKKARYQYKGKIMTLMIVGFDKFGRLQLQDEMGKIITCDLKEIKFLMG